ncbi:hypothetical protein [Candidatus Methanocrinis natronophilus]|uniref:Uncharacterized protein n=1 Tax=Candidatus Methanocrinis natronophilus TaxID=3033396 RepID=A0ABT5X540_9EURY|nr:hypothetical protein [Candidatus Methanocrinis natronophilus]MDF0589814.1 hypothetical protein [Candidatus Methanocrinis natronophilus]
MRTISRFLGAAAALLILSFAGAVAEFPPQFEAGYEEGLQGRPPGTAFCESGGPIRCEENDPALISILLSGRGVALGPGGETLPLRLRVEKVRWIDPSQVRRLLEENKTLGEIRAEIGGDDGAYGYRGNLRLGRAHYILEGVKVGVDGEKTSLEAELLEPAWGEILVPPARGLKKGGTISIDSRDHEGSAISVGSLIILSGPLAGSYVVLLDPPAVGGRGQGPHTSPGGDLVRSGWGFDGPGARDHLGRPASPSWGWRGVEVSIWGGVSKGSQVVVMPSSRGPGCPIGSGTSAPCHGR